MKIRSLRRLVNPPGHNIAHQLQELDMMENQPQEPIINLQYASISKMTIKILIALSLALASSRDVTLVQNRNNEPVIGHHFDHPEDDAERALLAGDRSLRGVNRFTTIVPGISADYSKLQTKYKIIVIENTSDVIVNDPKSYNNMAERYALSYNRHLFDRLGCDYRSPSDKCTNYP
jgi:hypothetical protein